MYAAVREFAREQLAAHAADAELAAAALRHARYYAALAAELVPLAQQGTTPDAAAQLARERGNLTAAAEHALAAVPPDVACALQAITALEPVLLAGGPGSELAALLERAIDAAEGGPHVRLQAHALHLRARLSTPTRLDAARSDLARVLSLAERDRDAALTALHARAWLDLGVVHHFARDLEAARSCYATALEQLSGCDDAVSEARCHGNLAALAHDRSDLAGAVPGYRRAIALLDTLDEPRALANFCSNLGLCEHELGQVVEARAHYARAIALLERLGDARLLGIVLGNLGTLELAAGDVERALALQERACALLENGGDARSEGLGLARRSAALALLDRLEDAERQLVRAERCCDATRWAVRPPSSCAVTSSWASRGGTRGRARSTRRTQRSRRRRRARTERRRVRAGEAAQATGDDERLYLRLLAPELASERAVLADERAAGESRQRRRDCPRGRRRSSGCREAGGRPA